MHTQVDKGQIIEKLAFGGGREFQFPDGSVVRSANISPDNSGIGQWTEEQFVLRFKMFSDSSNAALQRDLASSTALCHG